MLRPSRSRPRRLCELAHARCPIAHPDRSPRALHRTGPLVNSRAQRRRWRLRTVHICRSHHRRGGPRQPGPRPDRPRSRRADAGLIGPDLRLGRAPGRSYRAARRSRYTVAKSTVAKPTLTNLAVADPWSRTVTNRDSANHQPSVTGRPLTRGPGSVGCSPPKPQPAERTCFESLRPTIRGRAIRS